MHQAFRFGLKSSLSDSFDDDFKANTKAWCIKELVSH